MPALERGESSNCSSPVLDMYTRVGSVPIDIYSAEFVIFEKVTNPPNLVQVFPVVGRETVDVGTDCPTGHKLGTGRYVAEWNVPLSAVVGNYEIHWYWKQTAAHAEREFCQEFNVLLEGTGASAPGYCTVQDLRDEGITDTMLSDARAEMLIAMGSTYIELVTGRWFEARDRTFRVKARKHPILHIGHPIIKVDQLFLVSGRGTGITRSEISVDDVLVFNRHLTEGLVSPDDRDNPKLEYGGIFGVEYPGRNLVPDFPWGSQVVEVVGTYGYTELPRGVVPGETSDGSQVPANQGVTPPLVTHVCKLLAVREMGHMGDPARRGDWRDGWRVESEKTFDQSYKMTSLSSLKQSGAATGDPEIDGILMGLKAPAVVGVS